MSNMETSKPYSQFSTILKVHGGAIHLKAAKDARSASYRILCRDLGNPTRSEVQLFVLNGSGSVTGKGFFHRQQSLGQALGQEDLAIFMTTPVDSSTKVSFAFDLGISQHSNSLEDINEDVCRKVGTAFLYLEPNFSTSGVQRMPILSSNNHTPIGQLQVEYLIVRNPDAFDVEVPRPNWLNSYAQLDGGHRGAGVGCRPDLPGSISENTIASFNYAHKHGADMCELDVMCTADGVPVVYHNYALGNIKPGVSQINQLTLAELQEIKNSGIHDKNCTHNLDVPQSTYHPSCKPFPTLQEVLQEVEPSCILNIELKWAQLLANGKSEAVHYREINDNVDRILDCINHYGGNRPILLSTFNADVAIMLRLKQSQYPVLFLTTGDCKRFNDPITKTIKNAIHFAKAFDMAGINPNATHITEHLVRYAHDRGLLVYVWGKMETTQEIKELRRMGTNGVIYDKIDLIKPCD